MRYKDLDGEDFNSLFWGLVPQEYSLEEVEYLKQMLRKDLRTTSLV